MAQIDGLCEGKPAKTLCSILLCLPIPGELFKGTLEMIQVVFPVWRKIGKRYCDGVLKNNWYPLLWCMSKSPVLWKREQVIMMVSETARVTGEIHQLFL